jgi:hypothetical protein
MRYLLTIAWVSSLAAGGNYDPDKVLTRAIQKTLASARQIPNYTCVETVSRYYYAPLAVLLPRDCTVLLEQRRHPTPDLVLRLYSSDRLRLDVTMANRGEIYSWPGASRFEDAGIDQVVRHGPISTGSFGGIVDVVFKGDVKTFLFGRTITAGDRTLMEYSFQVAQPGSHYTMRAGNSWVRVAYSGTLQVDAETADVVRMTITTGDLPPATGACNSTTTMDIARVQIGGGQSLLPAQARQRFVYRNAEETENTTSFTNCREFRGESTVTFSPDSRTVTDERTKSASEGVLPLPTGLRFSFGLTASIPTDTAAAGDPFSGRLSDAIRDRGGKLVAPKGAVVDGRLLRVQSFFRPPQVVVVLRPEALWIHGARVPLSAERDWTRVFVEAREKRKKPVAIVAPLPGEDNSGAFGFAGTHVVVPKRFPSEWRTAPPRGSAQTVKK